MRVSFSGGIGGNGLLMPQSEALPPLALQSEWKNDEISHIWQILFIFVPSEMHFAPSIPPLFFFWCCHWLLPITRTELRMSQFLILEYSIEILKLLYPSNVVNYKLLTVLDIMKRVLLAAYSWGPSVASNFYFGRPKMNFSGFLKWKKEEKKKKKGTLPVTGAL